MPVWRVFLSAPIWDSPNPQITIRANRVQERTLGSSLALGFWAPSVSDPPSAAFRIEDLIGYSSVQYTDRVVIWLRSPDEKGSRFIDVAANFILPGAVGKIATVDLKQRETDTEPLVRFIAGFVTGYVQTGP